MKKNIRTSVKILAGIVGIMVALSFVFSLFFITIEADHECEGEECHICRTLEVCEGLLRQSGAAVTSGAVPVAAVWIICLVAVPVMTYVQDKTLVTDKVKMND
jgi:hypothetical protein